MKKVIKIVSGLLVIAIIVCVHVSYMEYVRGYFAIGSEWLAYTLLSVGVLMFTTKTKKELDR